MPAACGALGRKGALEVPPPLGPKSALAVRHGVEWKLHSFARTAPGGTFLFPWEGNRFESKLGEREKYQESKSHIMFPFSFNEGPVEVYLKTQGLLCLQGG